MKSIIEIIPVNAGLDWNTTLDDMLIQHKQDSDLHLGIGMVNRKFSEYEYKYVVNFDTKTIRVTGHERDVTVAFGQVVEFDGEDKIIET